MLFTGKPTCISRTNWILCNLFLELTAIKIKTKKPPQKTKDKHTHKHKKLYHAVTYIAFTNPEHNLGKTGLNNSSAVETE